jgi:DNA-binding CsgD family transcriptional regulator
MAGMRANEPGTDPVLLAEIIGNPATVQLSPWPLTDRGVAELVAAWLSDDPDPEFVRACLTATGGNPLLLRQLLTSLEADGVRPVAAEAGTVGRVGPRAVSRTVLARLRRLSAEATTVARAVAILNTNTALPLVSALTGLPELSVAEAIPDLVRAEILAPESPLVFVHPLVRDAVYHELPPGQRELLHARAAEILADARFSAEAVATQLLAAPRRGETWVIERLSEAARAALHKGAADSAVAYLKRAVEEPPAYEHMTELVLELGQAEMLISGTDAAAHLRQAWAALQDPRQKARTAAALARVLMFTAPGEEAEQVTRQALQETPAELVDEREALLALRQMALFFGAGDVEEVSRLDEIEVSGEGPGARMLAATTSLTRMITGRPMADCVAQARWALADGILFAADPGLFPVGPIIVLNFADLDEALDAWDELRDLAYRQGSILGALTVGLWRGATLAYRGDLREAEELLEGVHDEFATWGLAHGSQTYIPGLLGLTKVLRGDLAGARTLLSSSLDYDHRGDGERHLVRANAELALAEGRFAEAVELADDLGGRLSFVTMPGWAMWRSLKARALDGLGRTDEALKLAHEDLEHARRFGSAGVVGAALRLIGTLERDRGIAHLRDAVELLERSVAKLELAHALCALGAALRRSREPTEAREPLRRGLELAERCGADGLVEQARTELYAAGARPRTAALSGVESLTASERRVADLAADGRSNKEIAQTLYVTPKTVEVHLSNAYRKLNISSRQQLRPALAR